MRDRLRALAPAALAVVAAAIACGSVVFVGWAGLSVFGLAALAVAKRLDPKAPTPAPDGRQIPATVETYANQLAKKRRRDGAPGPVRLAHLARTTGIALLAIGLYMLVRQQF